MAEEDRPLTASHCTEADFLQILRDIEDFWGPSTGLRTVHGTRALHQPTLVHEFGDTSLVVRDGETVVAYLFGFRSQKEAVGYVQLVAVRPQYRRRGLARELYRRFAQVTSHHGCTELKALTSPDNLESIAFHASLGMLPQGTSRDGRVPVVEDYAGPGEARVVLRGPVEGAL